ncbi:MAG: alanine racemase [Verrucomicrobia bacterium]|nr:alanine racemase [Verrucomicrobiota bacterium]
MNRSWIEVDGRVLDANVQAVRQALGEATQPILVVKANAYGHGLAPFSQRAAQQGISWFAVAYADEAVVVRSVAPEATILVLGAADHEDIDSILDARMTPVLIDLAHGHRLSAAAVRRGVRIPVHVKVDTGMGRFGIPWDQAVAQFADLDRLPGLDIQGLCTHFASVELGRPSLGPQQMERFMELRERLGKISRQKLFCHASSSRAFLFNRGWDLDGVRPGIVLYGYGASQPDFRFITRPILQWKTRVMMVKDVPANFPVGYYSSYTTKRATRIATISAGYADGYHRLLSNRGVVFLRGKSYPVVGRVSMNWITVDLGPEGEAEPGDAVTLLGAAGEQSFWADEMAKQARTIPYEILTSIDPRAERIYLKG